MTSRDIARYRLYGQQISHSIFTQPEQLVAHMGAMQAQDFGMMKWALGLRLPGLSEEHVNQALDEGSILRTHLLRPTWHLAAAADLPWMLELSAPQLRPAVRSWLVKLSLTPAVLKKATRLIRKELEEDHKTREELMTVLGKSGIDTNELRSGMIMFHAELEGLVCSGRMKGSKTSYALLEQRSPCMQTLPREQALAKLAGIYFTSHGPAAVTDFAWWAGLNLGDARKGLEAVKDTLQEFRNGEQSLWYSAGSVPPPKHKDNGLYLLPAFDEFLISYKDRSASLGTDHKAITVNGIFHPTVLLKGQVCGLWKRTIKKDAVMVSTSGLTGISAATGKQLQRAADTYAAFSDRKAVLQIG